jgi:hypothetical protein
MRKILLILIGLFCSTIFIGCEQSPYQITKSEDGTVYRLNKKTGELFVIKDNKLIPLETPEMEQAKKALDKVLEEPIDWGEYEITGKDIMVKLKTAWRDGKIYYECIAFPYKALDRFYRLRYSDSQQFLLQKFTIGLHDKNNFLIKEIPIYIKDMTILIGGKGERDALGLNSNVELSRNDYENISVCSVGWNLSEQSAVVTDEDEKILKNTWRHLQKGMTQLQVRNLLGEPTNIKSISGSIYWYYPNSGVVVYTKILTYESIFDNTQQYYRLDSWSEPQWR